VITHVVVPSHEQVLAELAETEMAEGWLARCEDAGQYVALNAPFVRTLAGVLQALGAAPVLEVCAGDGSLAAALRYSGVEVIATDVQPPTHALTSVEPISADEALRRYRPRVVLGSFVPVDADVDQRVLDSPEVWEYVVLNARLGGEFGAPCLWTHGGWTRTPLGKVKEWMVSRHDVWLGPGVPPLSHSEAWRFSRIAPAEYKTPYRSEPTRIVTPDNHI
jgi:hypothetical protein